MKTVKKSTDRKTELSNCTFTKTILMLIVVMYHSILFWTENWLQNKPVFESKILSLLAEWMNSFHIYGFTLISGYLFYYQKHEKNRYSIFYEFAKNKFKRLVIPYIFVSIVWVIPFALLMFKYNVKEIFVKYILGTSPNQLWFLIMLFGVFMVFFSLDDFIKRSDVKGLILIVFLYFAGLIGELLLPNILQIFRVFKYVTFFWLGFKIRQYGSQQIMRISTFVWIMVDTVFFSITHMLSKLDGSIFVLLELGFSYLLHIIGALMSFVILQKLAIRINWMGNKIFVFLSKYSMAVYLFHQQVIYVLISCLNGVVNPYLHAAINFVGAMAASILISALLMKFKWTKILIGEK